MSSEQDHFCVVCTTQVDGYEPVFCCDGFECGCMGKPIEPCLCDEHDDIINTLAELKKQAACDHHHNGVGQYSPYKHAWKCDKCGHIKR